MKRGDIVSVALQGNAGKPRPALVIQSDLLGATSTVLVIPFSSTFFPVTFRRVTIAPAPGNGLAEVSQLMIERMASIRRDKCGPVFGQVSPDQLAEVDARLAFVLGLGEVLA
ncbi:type II toxin-antitoxin system PemK/MazF family toxin [Glacieibacterium sp.]|uniref:type II toxin-antitoxin system PemK/MazF family toxin n=1 Tax=Glacieibacterium sp. TaxID=2860237 RepID=UPI003AFF7CFC